MGILLLATATETLAQNSQTYYIYKDGNIRHRLTTTATKMKANKETGTFNLYNGSTSVYETPLSQVDQISKVANPKADLLDVVFLDDGSAIDISGKNIQITKVGTPTIAYSKRFHRNVAKFDNTLGGGATQFFAADYNRLANYTEYEGALANGHTLECVCCVSSNPAVIAGNNKEGKPFSAHSGGGTGFLIRQDRNSDFIFLPHTGDYRWADSGVTPSLSTFYHIVGVYDKANGKARIYVDGLLKATVNAEGMFNHPGAGNKWFGIGCDPAGYSGGYIGECAWNGTIVLARVYSGAKSDTDVANMYKDVQSQIETTNIISDVNLVSSGLRVKRGGKFLIEATTFQTGDKVIIRGQNGQDHEVNMEQFLGTWYFTVPDDLSAGNYTLIFKRGANIQELGVARIEIITNEGNFIPQGTRVIAHRGDWQNGSNNAQNSRASLKKALENNYYGSECDVYITDPSEPRVIVNHDITINGTDVTTAQESYFRNHGIKLSNSEEVPFLDEFLKIMKEEFKTSSTKLIIEIKDHAQSWKQGDKENQDPNWGINRGKACIDATVALVDQYGMQDRVEYISFNLDYCKYIHSLRPDAHVAYLNNDKWPQLLLDDTNNGVMGLDYTADTYRKDLQWVWEAHVRGMTTNVWTIDDEATMREMANHGIDFITTNKPSTAQALYNATKKHYELNSDLMLDVQFNGDNVTDASPFKRTVQKNGTVTNGYFNNDWNTNDVTNYCRVDYENDQMFKAALTDGHTFESIFCVNGEGGTGDFEKKWFSSHEGDGTGFLLAKNSQNQKLSFIVKTQDSDNAWRWAQCENVLPATQVGTYYHVFGVYDKAGQKVRIYAKQMNSSDLADGYTTSDPVKGSADAKGSIVLAYDGRQWIGIGADTGSEGKAQNSGKWHVKRARIYNRAMTDAEVDQLWGK